MNARQKKLAGVIAFTCGLALLAWRFLYPPEPAYNGKSLTAWAQQYGSNHWGGTDRAADKEAEFAIRQIGTNAIPFLLDLIRVRDSALKKKLRTAVPRQWHAKLHLVDTSQTIRRTGAHGLAALGTNASSALPALIQLATCHTEADGRYIAVFAIRTLGTAAEPAIPFLIQCLTNEVSIIRDDAALGLGYIRRRPEISVPALIDYLESSKASPRTYERVDSIEALGRFGAHAKPAIPLLLALLNDPQQQVRQTVTNSLLEIDANAAAKAGVTRPGANR